MTRNDLLKKIEEENTKDVFDPYNCCQMGVTALVRSLSDDLLPTDYYVEGREPILCWTEKYKIKFMTRYSFRVLENGDMTKRHQFGDFLSEEYINKIKKYMKTNKKTITSNIKFSKYYLDK